jgi:hypothetical protein
METILTRLQQSFSAWRSSSSKKRCDANLREQAVKCLDHYSYSEVSKSIGMSINTLRSWQKSLNSHHDIGDSRPAFIAMRLDSAQNIDAQNQAQLFLKINLPRGITINVESTSIASSAAFIVALNKECEACSI